MSKINRIFNKLLAGAIALLGFSACSTEDEPNDQLCMYGTPQGTYSVSGVVYNENGEKLDGAMVTTSLRDTVYTKDGKYTIGPKIQGVLVAIEVKAEDPKGGYSDQTQKIKLEYKADYEAQEYAAKAEADFHLHKAE